MPRDSAQSPVPRQAPAEHKPKDASYRTLIESADDPILQLDRFGNFLFINEAGPRRLGLQKEQMIGRNIRDFFPAEAERLLDPLESVFSTGQIVSTLRRVSINGNPVDYSAVIVPLKNDDGEVQSAVVVLRDVSRIRKWARAAKRNQQRIRELFRNMGEGVGIVDTDERFRFANPAAHSIFGIPPGQLKNRSLREFVTADGWQQILRESRRRKHGLRSTYQLEFLRSDGEMRVLQVTATPRYSRSGTYLGTFGVFYDVTLQRRVEEALRRTGEELEESVAETTEELRKSQERLRQLAASLENSLEEESKRISREIHDELGQNLTAAKYEVAGLRREIPSDQPVLLRRLDALNQRLDSVSDDVRRIAQNLRPPLLDHFGLEAALEGLAADFEQRTGIQCQCELGTSDSPVVEPIATSVFRICQEALTNVARHAEASLVKMSLSCQDDRLLVRVSDNGRGIRRDELRKPTLGLLGMEERARRLGGSLRIGPGETRGTEVSIVIPLRTQNERGSGQVAR